MSNMAWWPNCFMAALIARHCSGEGSTPVGLCAHACSKKKLPRGAAAMSVSIPARSRPRVEGW